MFLLNIQLNTGLHLIKIIDLFLCIYHAMRLNEIHMPPPQL